MYTLYIGNKNYSSWSLRPWVLLKTLNIPFDEKLMPFDDGSSWQSFREFSPTGLVPCLFDGDQQVWESLAIVEYLAEDHPEVWPQDRTARAWARCASAEMHAGFAALRNDCPMTVGLRMRLHQISAPLQKDLDRLNELWQHGLDEFGGPYLSGTMFTAVDAFFAPVVFRLQTYGLATSAAATDYAAQIVTLPAMQAWAEAALQEPWREPSHEKEIAQLGERLEDLRK